MDVFNDAKFRQRVDNALTQVKKILKAERNPTYMESVPHEYNDKFTQAEFLSNVTLAALVNCFEAMGIQIKSFIQMNEWVKVSSFVPSDAFFCRLALAESSGRVLPPAENCLLNNREGV